MNIKLLKEICEVPGTSGFEDKIRRLVLEELKSIDAEIDIDNRKCYTIIKGENSNKKVMLAAHMDEIGFIVKHIDEQGFLRFHTLGGLTQKH